MHSKNEWAMRTKRVIITGATGFVGANLARRLLRDGHELHLLVRKNYTAWRIETIRSNVKIHEVDLLDADKLNTVVKQVHPDWIFHLATYGAYSSQTNIHKMIQTNLTGTVNLVEACLKTSFEAFVNTGSSSEYGYKDHAPSEKEWLEPNSHYAVTKASATLLCRFLALSRHVRLVTLRLYSVYGPFEEPTRLIPTLIIHGLRGDLPTLVNANVARDFVYVEDVNDAYLLAASGIEQEIGSVYNIGTGRQTSIMEVVATARRKMKITADPLWGSMQDRNWDTAVWVADNKTAQESLSWKPRYDFNQGFEETINWFIARPEMIQFYQRHQELPG